MFETSADALKAAGNAAIKEGKWHEAADRYTEALAQLADENDDDASAKLRAVLHSNRAMARAKLEEYGTALADAEAACEADPTYAKAWHRKATALTAMTRYKEALTAFKQVVRLQPQDRAARAKVDELKKLMKKVAFEEAIRVEHKSPFAELHIPDIPDDYTGPRFEGDAPEDPAFLADLVAHFKGGGMLARPLVYKLLKRCDDLFRAEPTLVETPDGADVVVCGDTHGQFFDLCHIFDTVAGLPTGDGPCFLFNGDLVDRGSWSVEVALTLYAAKALFPKRFFINRGNHETRGMNVMYGFDGECVHKLGATALELFSETFKALPLATLIDKRVFVCHGGLFAQDGVTLDDIRAVDRFREPPGEGIMCDLLWADPAPDGVVGRIPSKRGTSIQFGADVTKAFCEGNGLECVIRSHEVRDDGYSVQHDGRCITVFSAPNYVDQMGNKGAVVRVPAGGGKLSFQQFEAQEHPKIPPMAYNKQGAGLMM